MKIRYVGGRVQYTVSFNRKKVNFTRENDYTIEVTDQKLANHIGRLTNNTEFEFVVEENKEEVTDKKKSGRPKKEK